MRREPDQQRHPEPAVGLEDLARDSDPGSGATTLLGASRLCDACGYQRIASSACTNRYYPKCQSLGRSKKGLACRQPTRGVRTGICCSRAAGYRLWRSRYPVADACRARFASKRADRFGPAPGSLQGHTSIQIPHPLVSQK
jgi:hypothetical protein